MLSRLPIIGLFGSGTKITAERAALARDVGVLVARLSAHLLTGASYALTEAAAEGFVSVERRRGVCIGALRRDVAGAFDRAGGGDGIAYASRHIEVAVLTTMAELDGEKDNAARNRVNVLTANAIIALPGSVGTRDELQMAATCDGESDKKPGERRTILVGPGEEFAHELRNLFVQVPTAADAEVHVCQVLAAQGFLMERLMR